MSALRLLEPDEIRLEGSWVESGGKVVADETARRIGDLVSTALNRLCGSADGWDVLYVDPRDGRLWS